MKQARHPPSRKRNPLLQRLVRQRDEALLQLAAIERELRQVGAERLGPTFGLAPGRSLPRRAGEPEPNSLDD
jgi:hypothetical protein